MNNKIPTSLHILAALNRGGIETWLMNLVRRSRREELPIDVCLTTTGNDLGVYAEEFQQLGSRIWRCPGHRNPLVFASRFRDLLREGGYKVVHSHPHHFSGYILKIAKQAGVPVRIAHSHSDRRAVERSASALRRLYLKYTEYLVHRHATAGFACSDFAATSLFGDRWREDARWRVMPCGIDLESFIEPVDRLAVRREFGFEPHHRVIGHVGRFVSPKNHSFLVDIAAEIVRMEPNARFLLIGEGDLRENVQQKVRSLGLSEYFVFAGGRDDVPRVMRGAMDTFLLPSLYEGLGIVLLEAQAAGLPCIVSDVVPSVACVLADRYHSVSLEESAVRWAAACIDTPIRDCIDTPIRDCISGLSIKSFDIHPSRVSAEGCMNPTDGTFKNFLDAPISDISEIFESKQLSLSSNIATLREVYDATG